MSNKLGAATFVVSLASLCILTVFAVKGIQAQAKVESVTDQVKSAVADPVKFITGFFQR